MNRRALNLVLLTALMAACARTSESPSSQPTRGGQADLALVRVHVVDVVDGSLRSDQTVLISGNRIAVVGPSRSVAVPRGARVVDGTDRYLVPGLWDMHVHSAANVEWHFPLFISHGVTGVRNMHTTVDTALELTLAIKQRLVEGTLHGPRFIANGPILDGPVPIWPTSVRVGTAAEARAAVDSLAAGGADFIKVYERLSREAYFAAAEQARRRGIPFVGHVPGSVHAMEAVDAGQRSIEHIDALSLECSSFGDSIRVLRRTRPPSTYEEAVRLQDVLARSWSAERCAPTIEALRRNGTWFVPTIALYRAEADRDSALAHMTAAALIPPAMLRRWEAENLDVPEWRQDADRAILEAGMGTVSALHRAGVPLLAGTDVGNPLLVPGQSLHDELELLVAAGLSPLEALRTATVNPALFLEAADSLGSVEPGKLADLVLLDANPLEDIGHLRRIRAVVLNGRLVDRPELDRLLAEVEARMQVTESPE